ncbi:outer membrane protein assembly factor BamE [Pantoea vagans]|uniref:outer membrane protein assembly factor BamE n=1 Tax=Pantoea vagans TaxID=470934 RepID=UPI00076B485B|nr:outer membrane protein assembly factor BamE [Pantoea vagans]AMG59241.1 outer membrane protein assembly factor BamE [Pantoea vagans]
MKAKVAGALLTIIVLSGCSSTAGNQSIKNETQQSIASKIFKGRTTKQDIQKQFGEPTRKTTVDTNEDMWFYSIMNSNMSAMSYIPIVGLFSNGTDMKSKNLTITFTGDKVENWSFSESNDSVHNGL